MANKLDARHVHSAQGVNIEQNGSIDPINPIAAPHSQNFDLAEADTSLVETLVEYTASCQLIFVADVMLAGSDVQHHSPG